MKSRHKAREVALQILYRYDMALHADKMPVPTGAQLAKDLEHHFNHWSVPETLREFAAELVAGTLSEMPALDELMEKHASNWKVARMGYVDRNLLRMAAYEMMRFPDTSPSIVIDEAIELGKQFGTAETASFVNGLLDAIRIALKAKSAG